MTIVIIPTTTEMIPAKTEGEFVNHWTEIYDKAMEVDKQPILIAKQNFFPSVICTTSEGLSKLNLSQIGLIKIGGILCFVPLLKVYIMELEWFLTEVSPDPLIDVNMW